jgi:hypothetical protein
VFVLDANKCFLDTIVSTKKGKVTMITQALKRWLQKIAGWFSGNPPEEAEYTPARSILNKGMTQETASRASSEAIMPQPGIAHPPETTNLTTKDKPVSKSKSVFPDAPPPTPTPEQQLEFMHYLVKRGIVNEGFTEGQVPEQYRKH